MSHYDLLVGLNQDRLNLITQQAYDSSSLKSSLFSGKQSGEYSGIQYALHWSLESAPTFDLRAPTNEEWNQAIKEGGNKAAPQTETLIVELSKLSIKLSTDSENICLLYTSPSPRDS